MLVLYYSRKEKKRERDGMRGSDDDEKDTARRRGLTVCQIDSSSGRRDRFQVSRASCFIIVGLRR